MPAKKNIFRRNKRLIVIAVVLFILNVAIIVVWQHTSLFSGVIPISPSFSFNILTIDAVFAGFGYNTLGTVVSFLSNDSIRQKDQDGYMDHYYNGLYLALMGFLIAMIFGAITAFSNLGEKFHFLYMLQLLSNLDAAVFFVNSAFGLRRLINQVRK